MPEPTTKLTNPALQWLCQRSAARKGEHEQQSGARSATTMLLLRFSDSRSPCRLQMLATLRTNYKKTGKKQKKNSPKAQKKGKKTRF